VERATPHNVRGIVPLSRDTAVFAHSAFKNLVDIQRLYLRAQIHPRSLLLRLDVERSTKVEAAFLSLSCEAMEIALTIADQVRIGR
jgi:hypothetical protein